MSKSREAFDNWLVSSGFADDIACEAYPEEIISDCWKAWEASRQVWQAAKAEPDAATVALHFGYEVTKIRDQVFIAKNNIGMKLWIPFNRESHPKLFQEYDRCN